MGWVRRLQSSFGSGIERDIDDELRFHLDARVEDYRRAGMTPLQARDAALGRFGNVAAIRKSTRDIDTIQWLAVDSLPLAVAIVVVLANVAVLSSLAGGGEPASRTGARIEAGNGDGIATRALSKADSWRTPACRFALFLMQTSGDMPRVLNPEALANGCPVAPYAAVGNIGARIGQ